MLIARLILSIAMLVAVPALVARQLRHRRGRWLLVGVSVIAYLVLAQLVSRGLVGVVYPADPAGYTAAQLELRLLLHSATSVLAGAAVTVLLFAGVRRVVPRDGAPSPG